MFLALKRFNRSLKSELTNIVPFNFPGMLRQFPGSLKAFSRRPGLPKLQIKRSIQVGQLSSLFDKMFAHG